MAALVFNSFTKKRTLTFLFSFGLTLCCLFSNGQGPQTLVTVPVKGTSYWGDPLPSSYQGYLYLPADYSTSTKRYPVILFYHGTSGVTTLSTVLESGLPNLIANGMRPDNITSPSDGQNYSFIVLSLMDPDPCAIPSELRWLNANYRIDNNRVYTTGLSSGGLNTWITATTNDSISKLITAIAPMSAPGVTMDFKWNLLKKYVIKTWAFAGSSDSYTSGGSVYYNQQANLAYPSSSTLTLYSGGHCCWNTYYNINYKDAVKGQSIYQWFLTMSNASKLSVLPVKFKSITLKKKA